MQLIFITNKKNGNQFLLENSALRAANFFTQVGVGGRAKWTTFLCLATKPGLKKINVDEDAYDYFSVLYERVNVHGYNT
jgi:hypothetical protein